MNLENLLRTKEDLPELPECLDSLLDQPYTKEASMAIDRWHKYVEIEWQVSDG